jgi:hypothetical protein
MLLFFNIRLAMVSKKYSELTKKQARDCYKRFTSPSSYRTAPSPSCQEVSSDDSVVEMWEVAPPSLTRLEEASSGDSPQPLRITMMNAPTSKR